MFVCDSGRRAQGKEHRQVVYAMRAVSMNATLQKGTVRPSKGAQHPSQYGV